MKRFTYRGKHEQKKAARLPLSAYLSYLLVATLLFTGVSFSKFATTATGGDSGRVAKFVVSSQMTGGGNLQTLDLSVSATAQSVSWSFTVSNASEVAAIDQIRVVLPSACPDGLTLSMTEGGENIPLATDDMVTYTCSKNFELQGDQSHDWVLTFTADPDTYTGEILTLEGITVYADVSQVD